MPSLAEMAAAKGRAIDNNTLASIKVQPIHHTKLHPSEMNFYGQKEIEEMADSIALAGIIQPLIVRKTDMGEYEVIVGHRRRLGAIRNVERGIKECEFLPCIEVKASDKMVQEIKKLSNLTDKEAEDIYVRYILIASNSINRELTDFERMEQAMELKVIIPYLRGDKELKGRALRTEIAKEIKRSTGQVGTYESIYNNLIPEGLERFKNEEIGISVAAGLASLPQDIQKQLVSKKDLRLADIEKAKEILAGTVSESDTERTAQVPSPTRIESHLGEPENEDENGQEENEPISLSLTEENKEAAVHFIFDECHDERKKNLVNALLDGLVDLFRQGKDSHFGYNAQQTVFGKILPFENDVVRVSENCGYLVDFIHTDEYIRIPIYPFWKKFEECFGWMWREEEAPAAVEEEQKEEECNHFPKCYLCNTPSCNSRQDKRTKCIFDSESPCNIENAIKLMYANEPELEKECPGCCMRCDKKRTCGYACYNAKTVITQPTESTPTAVQLTASQAPYKINAYRNDNRMDIAYADNVETTLDEARSFMEMPDIRMITISIKK